MNRRALGNGRIWRRQQQGGSVYVADWRDAAGKRRRKVLSTDKRVAERLLADVIRKRDLCAAGLGIEEGFDRSIDELRDEFLEDLESRRSRVYAERVRCVLNRVVSSMRIRTIRDFQPQAYLIYRRSRLRDGIANRTANMELTTVRTMLNWAVRTGLIAFNPLQAVQSLPAGRGYEKSPRRALSDDEIGRFLAASERADEVSARHALATVTIASGTKGASYNVRSRTPTVPQTPMWLTLLETGARFGETSRLAWGDFSEPRATLTLRASTTKSRRERVIPIRRELVEVLTHLRVIHHEVRGRIPSTGDYIFLTPRGHPWVDNRRNALRGFREVLDAAGVPRLDERGEKVDIHSLRHTFASRLARNGVGLAQAQKLLGHSDPKLTAAIYTHLDAEDLRSAVEGLPSVRAAGG